MHPHLYAGKLAHCEELVKQLEECHAAGLLKKYSGGCNDIKTQLNLCLREERLIRTERNKELSKARKAKVQAEWKEIDEVSS